MKEFNLEEVQNQHGGVAITGKGFRAEIIRADYKLPGADLLVLITSHSGEEEAIPYRKDGRAFRREDDERLRLYTPVNRIVKDVWLLVDVEGNVQIETTKPGEDVLKCCIASEYHQLILNEGEHK